MLNLRAYPRKQIGHVTRNIVINWTPFFHPVVEVYLSFPIFIMIPSFSYTSCSTETVVLFKLTIRNIPESTIPGRKTTKGRVGYHFLVFGGLSFLVIEVKFELGTGEERADAIGRVADGIDLFSLP